LKYDHVWSFIAAVMVSDPAAPPRKSFVSRWAESPFASIARTRAAAFAGSS